MLSREAIGTMSTFLGKTWPGIKLGGFVLVSLAQNHRAGENHVCFCLGFLLSRMVVLPLAGGVNGKSYEHSLNRQCFLGMACLLQ